MNVFMSGGTKPLFQFHICTFQWQMLHLVIYFSHRFTLKLFRRRTSVRTNGAVVESVRQRVREWARETLHRPPTDRCTASTWGPCRTACGPLGPRSGWPSGRRWDTWSDPSDPTGGPAALRQGIHFKQDVSNGFSDSFSEGRGTQRLLPRRHHLGSSHHFPCKVLLTLREIFRWDF